MTIQSQTSRADYTGNGVTTLFAVPFYFLDNTHLQVLRTDNGVSPPITATLVLGSDYSVTGAGNPSGGQITLAAPPTASQRLSILRNVPYTQLTHYVPNDPFPAASHESALDKLTMEVQQLEEQSNRSIILPPQVTGVSAVLPLPLAYNLIGWNPTATALQNVDPITIATQVTYGSTRADFFNGDGATSTFNLSANPGNVNNLDLSIGGVTQRPGLDYLWTAGTTLTFTTPPPAGTNNILVRYSQALPQGSSDAATTAFIQGYAGAVLRTAQDKMRDVVHIFDFMTFAQQADARSGAPVLDHTAAINAAVATGCLVQFPYGDFTYRGALDLTQGGLIGQGFGTNGSSLKTRLWFSQLNGARGAITTTLSTQQALRPVLRKLIIQGVSWDPTTGANANGLDIEAPIDIEDVLVQGFNGHGAFFHTDAGGVGGPYASFIRNLSCYYNAKHGTLVGTGANVLTFINPQNFWNGAPAYLTAPTAAGSYDGFYASGINDGNPGGIYHQYTPESLTIIGGNSSYNARYGWNIDAIVSSALMNPGYAEQNKGAHNARIGPNLQTSTLRFSQLSGGVTDLQNDHTFTPYWPSLQVWVGGKQVFFLSSGTGQNYNNQVSGAGVQQRLLLTDDGSGNLTYLNQNQTPDGTALGSSGYSTVNTFAGFGSWAIGVGTGSLHMKIANNLVQLPSHWYQATTTGWNAANVSRGVASSMPSSGSWTTGDYYANINPSVLGSAGSRYVVMGWLRLTTGSSNVLNTDWVECHALTGT